MGFTSSQDARDALRKLANEAELVDKIELIPNQAVDPASMVTAALAPLQPEPRTSIARVSEALHGEVLDVLERREEWLRVRAPDGYIAWMSDGTGASGLAKNRIGTAGGFVRVDGKPFGDTITSMLAVSGSSTQPNCTQESASWNQRKL